MPTAAEVTKSGSGEVRIEGENLGSELDSMRLGPPRNTKGEGVPRSESTICSSTALRSTSAQRYEVTGLSPLSFFSAVIDMRIESLEWIMSKLVYVT